MISDTQRRVLELLATSSGPLRPGGIGESLWGQEGQKPQHYARISGRVLKALGSRGLVEWVSRRPVWGWVITDAGRDALKGELDEAPGSP